VTQPGVSCARNVRFLTNLLKMPLNLGLQAKYLRLLGIEVAESISGDKFATGSRIGALLAHAQTLWSQKSKAVSPA